MKISKRSIAGLGATAVLLLGAAYPAFAQTATEEATQPEEETADDREARAAERTDELAAALAEELGLDTETVSTALETVMTRLAEQREAEHRAALEERLDEAVADGSLTQEQADALLAAADAGVLPGVFGRGHHVHGFGPGRSGGPPDLLPDPSTPPSEEASTAA